MTKKCARCGKVLGIIRIALGLAMIYFWVTKWWASPEKIAFIGGAAHGIGLTFLSVTIWYWIAMIGEIVAGILLLLGYYPRLAAILTLIIMAFAIKAAGFGTNAILVSVAALIILVLGPVAWGLCSNKCCKGKSKCCGSKCDDKEEVPLVEAAVAASPVVDAVQDTGEKITEKATDFAEKAVEKVEDIKEKAQDIIEEVTDKVEEIKEKAGDVTEVMEDAMEDISDIVGDDDED